MGNLASRAIQASAVLALAATLTISGVQLDASSKPPVAKQRIAEVRPSIDAGAFQAEAEAIAAAVTESEEMLEQSDGKVLENESRAELAAAVEAGQARSELIVDFLDRYKFYLALGGITETNVPAFVEGGPSTEAVDAMADARAAVSTAQAEWQVEQDRIAAERRAAEAAAAAARAAAASTPQAAASHTTPSRSSASSSSSSSSSSSASSAAPAGATYSFNSIGAANQSAIDSCRGFGDTTGWLGVPSFSVHWDCGGSRIANLGVGQTIRINNGQYAGLWKAQGRAYTLNGNVHTTRDVRRTGGLQIQTCVGGSYSSLGYYLFTRVG